MIDTKFKCPHKPELRCNFCGKKDDEVDVLIAGFNVFICNECVELASEIVKSYIIKKEQENDITKTTEI